MTEPLMSDAELMKRLSAHPELRSRRNPCCVSGGRGGGFEASGCCGTACHRRDAPHRQSARKPGLSARLTRPRKKPRKWQSRREGKKTLLAHHLWRHRGHGAPIPKRPAFGLLRKAHRSATEAVHDRCSVLSRTLVPTCPLPGLWTNSSSTTASSWVKAPFGTSHRDTRKRCSRPARTPSQAGPAKAAPGSGDC